MSSSNQPLCYDSEISNSKSLISPSLLYPPAQLIWKYDCCKHERKNLLRKSYLPPQSIALSNQPLRHDSEISKDFVLYLKTIFESISIKQRALPLCFFVNCHKLETMPHPVFRKLLT